MGKRNSGKTLQRAARPVTGPKEGLTISVVASGIPGLNQREF